MVEHILHFDLPDKTLSCCGDGDRLGTARKQAAGTNLADVLERGGERGEGFVCDVLHRERLHDVLERAVLEVLQFQLCGARGCAVPDSLSPTGPAQRKLWVHSLSASRYTDLALAGRGLPGLFRSHSAIHSFRDRDAAASELVEPAASEG